MSSNRTHMFLIIAIVFILAGCTGAYRPHQNELEALMDRELQLAVDLIDAQVHADLRDGQLHSLAMARDTFVKAWIDSGESDVDAMSQYLAQKVEMAEAFTAFLVVNKTLNYYTTDGFLKQVNETDPVDDWFFSVRANDSDIEFNIDPDEANEGQLTIFFNERVLDHQGAFVAAIGLGIRLSSLAEIVESHREHYPHNLYFMTTDGEVLYYENNDRPLAGAEISERMALDQTAPENDVSLRYRDGGQDYLLRSRSIREINLMLVVEQALR